MRSESGRFATDRSRLFTASDKMRTLVFQNPHLLPVLSRFDIALGFGESTVDDVCRRDNVDVETFLSVCNYFSFHAVDCNVNVTALVSYLKSAHRYFIDYVLPGIRNKLIAAVSAGRSGDFPWLIIKFYDEYVDEVRRHMGYEEKKVFKYVMELCAGIRDEEFSISRFRENHLPIADKLREIKELFIGHYTAELGRVDLLNTVLFDIIICENDLMLHCALEDDVFVPAVIELENKLGNCGISLSAGDENTLCVQNKSNSESGSANDVLDSHGDIVLTTRERDIVRTIAQGLSNKEIADRLYLSVHTVTTHRRNISSKLNIHSASGLTIYALMHGIITLAECAPQLKK